MVQELEARLSIAEIKKIVANNGSREGYGEAVLRILGNYFTKLVEHKGHECEVTYFSLSAGKQNLLGTLIGVEPYQHVIIETRGADRIINFVSTDEIILEIIKKEVTNPNKKKILPWDSPRLYCNKIVPESPPRDKGEAGLWAETAKNLL